MALPAKEAPGASWRDQIGDYRLGARPNLDRIRVAADRDRYIEWWLLVYGEEAFEIAAAFVRETS